MAASISLLSRYRGCIAGAVFGDCFGAKFEHSWDATPMKKVVKYAKEIKKEAKPSSGKSTQKGFVLYTDDSCMTFDLGGSLVDHEKFVAKDVAKRFTETYNASAPQRYYGGNVGSVFYELAKSNYTCDPWLPASKQFNGTGSYGNGAAMRVSPVPLFAHGKLDDLVELTSQQSKLTHTHAYGVDGAILQSLAIEKVLSEGEITDVEKFCSELWEQLKSVVADEFKAKIYEEKLQKVIGFLGAGTVSAGEIEKEIGTGVTAQEAVPAAIFCFLYTLDGDKVPELKEYNGLVRAIMFSAAVSRDSDTVASMAGAIAGAYYGFDLIPPEWMVACEGADRAVKLANDLYKLNQK